MNNRKYCHGCLFDQDNCESFVDELVIKSIYGNERSYHTTKIQTYECFRRNLKSSFPDENKVSECRSCNEHIKWSKTNAGKWTPINLDGSPHWSSCPQANKWRGERNI